MGFIHLKSPDYVQGSLLGVVGKGPRLLAGGPPAVPMFTRHVTQDGMPFFFFFSITLKSLDKVLGYSSDLSSHSCHCHRNNALQDRESMK